jgi:hypothetical protein
MTSTLPRAATACRWEAVDESSGARVASMLAKNLTKDKHGRNTICLVKDAMRANRPPTIYENRH